MSKLLNISHYIFRKQASKPTQEEASASTESQSDVPDNKMVLEVVSPAKKGKGRKKRKFTQLQISIGRKSNRLIVKLPGKNNSSDSSSPPRPSPPRPSPPHPQPPKGKSTPTPIVIDSDDSMRSTRSGRKPEIIPPKPKEAKT